MGYYIEVPNNQNKAQQLRDLYGAEDYVGTYSELPEGKTLVCVVVNPMFDAAGIVYDQMEYDEWTQSGDTRPKAWLTLDTDMAASLNDRYAELLKTRT